MRGRRESEANLLQWPADKLGSGECWRCRDGLTVVAAVTVTRSRTDGNRDGGGRLGGLERVASTDTRTDGDDGGGSRA